MEKKKKRVIIGSLSVLIIMIIFLTPPVKADTITTYTRSDYVVYFIVYGSQIQYEATIGTTITYSERLITSGWPYYIPLYWYFEVHNLQVTFDYYRCTDPSGYLQFNFVALRTGCGDLKLGSPPAHGYYQHYCTRAGNPYNRRDEPAETVTLSLNIQYDRVVGIGGRYAIFKWFNHPGIWVVNADGNYLVVDFTMIRGDLLPHSHISQAFQFHHDLTIVGFWSY